MPTPDKDGQNIPQVSVKLSLGMCYKGEGSPFSESLFLPGSALRRGLAAWTRLFCESGRAGTGVQVSCWPPGAPPWHTLPPWPSENLLQEQRLVLPPLLEARGQQAALREKLGAPADAWLNL